MADGFKSQGFTFPQLMLEQIDKRANELGLSKSGYIRQLVQRDLNNRENLDIVDQGNDNAGVEKRTTDRLQWQIDVLVEKYTELESKLAALQQKGGSSPRKAQKEETTQLDKNEPAKLATPGDEGFYGDIGKRKIDLTGIEESE